jgi:hypothetical protein
MNFYQSANLGLLAAVVAGVVAGLVALFNASSGDAIQIIAEHRVPLGLLLFILMLRIKMAVDDHYHFGEEVQMKSGIRIAGFVLAVLTALSLAVAASQIIKPVNSAELTFVGILIATAWIGIHLLEITMDNKRRNTEVVISLMREKWLVINVIYCLLLAAFIGWFPSILPAGNAASLYLLYGTLAFDWVTSRQPKPAT